MKLVTLKKNREFGYVYNKGRSCATRNIVLIYKTKKFGGVRAGFSVSKKVGKSVTRNKKRRQLKESFRLYMAEVHCSCDMIFLARAPIANSDFKKISEDVYFLLKKSGLIIAE